MTETDLALLSQMSLTGRAPPQFGNDASSARLLAQFGQQLFFDKGLSPGRSDGTRSWTAVACADCHSPTEWFSDPRADNNVSQGVGVTSRNSPSLVNVAFYETWGWGGGSDTLWGQCHHAYTAAGTMAGTPDFLLAAVRARYADRYQAVFPQDPLPDAMPALADGGVAEPVRHFYRNILLAWAGYLASLSSPNAPFDRYVDGDRGALTEEQRRGLRLFLGKAGCIECHRGPLFTDNKYHSVGIGQSGRGVPEKDDGRAAGLAALRVLGGLGLRPEGAPPAPLATDADRGLFRTKGLRQVARTAPYFHAGQLATLKEVVWFYSQGGDHDGPNVSPFLVPLGLSEEEQADLVAFLGSLTGDEVPAELRCDSSNLPPGASLDAGLVTLPADVVTEIITGGDPICPFGGVKVTQPSDAGVLRVCNGANPTKRCEVGP